MIFIDYFPNVLCIINVKTFFMSILLLIANETSNGDVINSNIRFEVLYR